MARNDARKLTEEVRRFILAALSVGAYRADAARLAGITPTLLYKWLDKGATARANSKLAKFHVEVMDAEKRPKLAAMRAVLDSIRGDPENDVPGNPRIALQFLRLRYPDEWGGSSTLHIDATHHLGSGGKPKDDAPDSLSDLGLNDDQIHLLGTQLARLESGQVPVPALTLTRDEDDDSWKDGEEGVDWEYVVDDGEEG